MRLIGKLTPKLSLYGTISKTAEVIGSNIQPLTVRNNGTYEASNGVDGFNPIYVNTPEPKEEQEKIVDIIENGTVEVLPDGNKVLSKVTINSSVPDTSELLEDIIDNSGVLEDTDGTISITEKVEQLIDKVEELDVFQSIINANQLFQKAHSFPTKAIVNLPNAINARETFANWITEPIPSVDEITVNAPNITEAYNTFWQSWGVKKIILNLSDKCQKLTMTFTYARDVKEIVLNFPTQNIIAYYQTFNLCSVLERIVGVLDFSSTTNANLMFDSCPNLKEVRFAKETLSISISLARSSKLTNASKESIFNGLAQLEEGVTQTLTLHKDVKILQSQVDGANAKGWTVAGGTVVGEEVYNG